MSAGRESIPPEVMFEGAYSAFRSLDKMLWNYGCGRQTQDSLDTLREFINEFDYSWETFKRSLDNYEKEVFAKRL